MKEKLLFINISGTNSKVKLYENGNISENAEPGLTSIFLINQLFFSSNKDK